MNQARTDKQPLPPYVMFFLVQANMVGIGILNFQRELVQQAGYDAWISIIAIALTVYLLVWMIYKTFSLYQEDNADILGVNRRLFGKYAGWVMNMAIGLYFYMAAFIVFRRFLEVIQLWMFPLMNKYSIGLLILIVIYYAVSGGISTIAGVSFWGIVIPVFFLLIMMSAILSMLHPSNLLPVFAHSPKELLLASKGMVFQLLGFEAIWFVYPYLRTPAKSLRWSQWAVTSTLALYLLTGLTAFMYFSEGQLIHIRWPLLTMVKIIQIPLYQRMEYILISVWFLKVLANMSISVWIAGQSMNKTLAIRPKWSLPILLTGFLILLYFVSQRSAIERISACISTAGIYMVYVYIPLLFLIVWIRSASRFTQN